MSHPRARELPGGSPARAVKSWTVAGAKRWLLAEKAFRVKQGIESIGEKAGMAAYASQNEAILILNLALDHAMAEGCVLLGRRNGRSPISRRPKAGAGHAQGSKNFPRAEALQIFPGDDFKRTAQQDKSRIGVLRVASRGCFKRKLEAGIQQLLTAACPLKKPHIPRQAGRMGEKHTQRHFTPRASCSFSLGKARKQLRQRLIKGERPTLMQKHSHGSGRDHLGDAGQVVDGGCSNRRRRLIVGEPANGIEREHLALHEHTESRSRKSLLRNRLLEN